MIQTRGEFAEDTNTDQRSVDEDQSIVSGKESAEYLTWTRVDALFILVTFFSCVALFSAPLLDSVGYMLVSFISVFAMLNPFSATLFLAASQTIPDAPGLPYTPAKLSAIGFAVALIFNNRFLLFPAAFGQVMKWLFPFMYIIAIKRVFFFGIAPFTENDLYMFAASFMIATYYREIAPKKWLWITILCIGATIGIGGNVLDLLGFKAVVQDTGGIRERVFVGRAGGATNIGMVAGAGGMIALWILLGSNFLKTSHAVLVRVYLLASFLLALVAIILSKSKGAIFSIATLFSILIFTALFMHTDNKSIKKQSSLRFSVFLLVVITLGLIFLPIQGLHHSIQNFFNYESSRMDETGEAWYLTGRYEVWDPAFEDFLQSSIILGVMPGQEVQTSRPAHNVFLDMAKDFGLLGLATFLFFFLAPTFALYRRDGFNRMFPFAFFLLGVFFAFNYTPFLNYKTFWVYGGGVIGILAAQSRTENLVTDRAS